MSLLRAGISGARSPAIAIPANRAAVGDSGRCGKDSEPVDFKALEIQLGELVAVVYTWSMTTTEMSTRETRDHFADRLEAARRGEVTLITSRGRAVAALVPAELLDEYERLAEAEDLRLIDERISRYEAGGTTTPLTEVLAETLARR